MGVASRGFGAGESTCNGAVQRAFGGGRRVSADLKDETIYPGFQLIMKTIRLGEYDSRASNHIAPTICVTMPTQGPRATTESNGPRRWLVEVVGEVADACQPIERQGVVVPQAAAGMTTRVSTLHSTSFCFIASMSIPEGPPRTVSADAGSR